ncbi:permease (Major facilitator superfamily) protein, putative [Acanthamoeba castellanii str. Neff]|uniref:Permease (Major facilitator superfamily ) protein, putative n=1 Tax=Acanthamoeba castellanii (strain ATCC 30010 / Neff) TaxID=1257118 RepID=L8H7P3_ACACF|nr:permease (Major facilitator superfamily) protein, putative [Acanthamoeba castellanii str. Neff]ELR20496.1 permease (Major facilitator superfamily) protein, putative [Acanthamoeba castellanii str. Neff]
MARFLQGASAAATWVAGLALLADTYPSHELGSAMGLVMTAMSLGMLLGPPFGGFVYQLGGIAILDAVVRVLLITERTVPAHSMPVLGEEEGDEPTPDTYLLHQPYKVLGYSSGDDRVYTDEDLEKLREHLPAPARRPPTFFAIMFNRNVLVTNVIVALGANAITVLEPTLPAVLDEKFNSSAAVIGLAFMVMALAHGLSAPVFGWLSDKIGGPVLMLIGLSSLSIALVLLHQIAEINTAQTLVSPPNSLWLTLLALLRPPTVDEMGGGAYGQVYAIFNWFYALGMLGGPLIGGALVDWLSFRAMLLVFAASCACFVPVAGAHWWALRRR